jgi:hypothetical protein
MLSLPDYFRASEAVWTVEAYMAKQEQTYLYLCNDMF